MSTASISILQSKLEKDIAWRKKEIGSITLLATQSSPDLHHIFRAGTVMLCAHWEGYLKGAIQRYVDHVLAQRLPLKELSPAFVANLYFRDVKSAAKADYPGAENHHIRLAQRILKGIDAICEPPSWDMEGEANPGTGMLDRLLRSVGLSSNLGLNTADWSTMKVFIDEHILVDRNKVAHGEYCKVEKNVFIERSERLVQLLDILTDLILQAALRQLYRSAPMAVPPQ
ncbi:MAE_28990/MAE_18760 family HEPN-like nuclease [Myxococcus fulvus]|uniref:MAE_28990/MAE_18760 family HEPN-like nuclease n=1 Tax=Myxococcus fulvus TaxID=33 RepID=UPI0020C0A28A|nr:MAE_28990/MAE_18760 family HEPN-like nuclease [Myxococcus fulvus]MCK8503785.1 MAE_28990/MAE_18760 family HEPN-like nuclease [Myxococcus fulvus]